MYDGSVGDRSFNVPSVRSSNGKTMITFGLPGTFWKESKKVVDHNQLGVIYANEQALKALDSNSRVFPVGSIFVREKISPEKSTPELLAVMIKRENGYNPDGGDWQFLLTDGQKKKVKLRQKSGECLDCHIRQRDNDFVFPVQR